MTRPILDYLLESLRKAATYNLEVQSAPFCILWPDSDRQWQPIIPRLQAELDELFVLGDYAPENRTGPAIWLRCVVDGAIPEFISPGKTPILYLPGVSRMDLGAIENCPDFLKAIAELQYRGVIWSQVNSKDWTVLAYLKSKQGGLNLDIAQDEATKKALLRSLYLLLDEEIELLRDKRLDKDYFNTLVTGGDPTRNLLLWLDQGEVFQQSQQEPEWLAFVEVCKSLFNFNPPAQGVVEGVTQLANQSGPWETLWQRYCEAPKRYPKIPDLIRRQCQPPKDVFWQNPQASRTGWPQWNEDQETQLRQDLNSLGNIPTHQARSQILELEQQHSRRRQLVWVKLGEAPLAQALQHLAKLAEVTQKALVNGTIEDLTQDYQNHSWQADAALLEAIAKVDKTPDLEAITQAIRAAYLPWAQESARQLQKEVEKTDYPGKTRETLSVQEGECWLFVDGLRFDLAKKLASQLSQLGYQVTQTPTWAALPSVTATGKPAVSPVSALITGSNDSINFESCVAETGKPLNLHKLLKDNGWQVLKAGDNGNGQGKAWCEFGNIDEEGHHSARNLAKQIDPLLNSLNERISYLIEAGWQKIHIVTDHGWLLLPGGLPKIDLPSVLTHTKWSRCAVLKPGVSTQERVFPWFWNPHQQFALADGIHCFRQGEDYAHGGLSLQECLTLDLSVTPGFAGSERAIEIGNISWKGLRCTVILEGDCSGLELDLRTQAANPDSSIVANPRPFKEDGKAPVVVEEDDLEGQSINLVIVNARVVCSNRIKLLSEEVKGKWS